MLYNLLKVRNNKSDNRLFGAVFLKLFDKRPKEEIYLTL